MNTLDTWTQSLLPADTLWPVVARSQPVLHGAPQVHILVQAWDSPHEGEAVISDIKTYQELLRYIKVHQVLSSTFLFHHLGSGLHRNPECIMRPCGVLLKWHGRKAISTVRKCTSSCVTCIEGRGAGELEVQPQPVSVKCPSVSAVYPLCIRCVLGVLDCNGFQWIPRWIL